MGAPSGLPIHLWNEHALSAIGNALGTFISVDKGNLFSTNRELSRVLVDMNIHHGLPEVHEIDSHGRRTIQRLDYLGIPIRCSICHKTDHLRHDCNGWSSLDDSEDTEQQELAYKSSPETNCNVFGSFQFLSELSNPPTPPESISGKLHTHCPLFFFILNCMEKVVLEASV